MCGIAQMGAFDYCRRKPYLGSIPSVFICVHLCPSVVKVPPDRYLSTRNSPPLDFPNNIRDFIHGVLMVM
jgi:hypothetical protein